MQFIDEDLYKNNIGIYGIKNLINQKVYVGQTRQKFQKRYWNHKWKLQNNQHDNRHLQSAWNKYGEENFEFFIIEKVENAELINDLEIQYISQYRDNNLSYNILDGGDGFNGCVISEETRKIIGEKNRQRLLGTKLSEETKQKMSRIRKGKYIFRPSDTLNEELAYKIKTMLVSGTTATEISKELEIDYKLINNIISNNTWSLVKVDGWEEFRNNRPTYKRLTKKDHQEIYRLHIEKGLTKYELADMYSKTVKMIEKIFREQRKLYDNPVPSLN